MGDSEFWENPEAGLPALREEDCLRNVAQLECSIKVLALASGFSAARAELYRATEPLVVAIERTPCPALQAFDLFDAQARTMLTLVSDQPTRDAYLHVLKDVYYEQAHSYLMNAPTQGYSFRYGGPSSRPASEEGFELVRKLDARLRFWTTEAFTKESASLSAGKSQPTSVSTASHRRKRKKNPAVQRIKSKVRELRQAGLDYKTICDRLDDCERPPRAEWRMFAWPVAYRRHTSAVTKWLSEACQ